MTFRVLYIARFVLVFVHVHGSTCFFKGGGSVAATGLCVYTVFILAMQFSMLTIAITDSSFHVWFCNLGTWKYIFIPFIFGCWSLVILFLLSVRKEFPKIYHNLLTNSAILFPSHVSPKITWYEMWYEMWYTCLYKHRSSRQCQLCSERHSVRTSLKEAPHCPHR